jgi:hypothetical protein
LLRKRIKMKKQSKNSNKHPVSRKGSEKDPATGKKEKAAAASVEGSKKLTSSGRTQGHNPTTESTKGNKMKAGKPYKQQ